MPEPKPIRKRGGWNRLGADKAERFSFILPPELNNGITRAADKAGINSSEWVRRLIAEKLEGEK